MLSKPVGSIVLPLILMKILSKHNQRISKNVVSTVRLYRTAKRTSKYVVPVVKYFWASVVEF